jgi:hypothetical protein
VRVLWEVSQAGDGLGGVCACVGDENSFDEGTKRMRPQEMKPLGYALLMLAVSSVGLLRRGNHQCGTGRPEMWCMVGPMWLLHLLLKLQPGVHPAECKMIVALI